VVDTSVDAIFGGAVVLEQPAAGYRFGIDSLLLGAGAPDGDAILDAGCAVGVVAMAVAHHQPGAKVVGVEIQERLVSLARANVVRNGMTGRVEVVESDLRSWSCGRRFDLVLMNPPFYPCATGKRNPDAERDAARHEVYGTLAELCRGVAGVLAPRGCVRAIFPAEQVFRISDALRGCGLKVSRLRAVHSFADSAAKLVLVDARNHGRREVVLAPPLVLFDESGKYTSPVCEILDGVRVVL
jgi:tRNA1Val (adenine37-N6)-methyltransferase